MTRILALALVILIPLTVIIVQWQTGKYREFLKTAKEAEGQIIFAENRIFDRKNNRKEFIIEYQFEIDGTQYEGQERLEYPDMESTFPLGSRVAVLYDPVNPSKNHLKWLLERRLKVGDALGK